MIPASASAPTPNIRLAYTTCDPRNPPRHARAVPASQETSKPDPSCPRGHHPERVTCSRPAHSFRLAAFDSARVILLRFREPPFFREVSGRLPPVRVFAHRIDAPWSSVRSEASPCTASTVPEECSSLGPMPTASDASPMPPRQPLGIQVPRSTVPGGGGGQGADPPVALFPVTVPGDGRAEESVTSASPTPLPLLSRRRPRGVISNVLDKGSEGCWTHAAGRASRERSTGGGLSPR